MPLSASRDGAPQTNTRNPPDLWILCIISGLSIFLVLWPSVVISGSLVICSFSPLVPWSSLTSPLVSLSFPFILVTYVS